MLSAPGCELALEATPNCLWSRTTKLLGICNQPFQAALLLPPVPTRQGAKAHPVPCMGAAPPHALCFPPSLSPTVGDYSVCSGSQRGQSISSCPFVTTRALAAISSAEPDTVCTCHAHPSHAHGRMLTGFPMDWSVCQQHCCVCVCVQCNCASVCAMSRLS